MKLLGTAVLALLCACNPNYGEGGFACTNGQCPSGYTCVNKICQKSGIRGVDGATTDKPVAVVDGCSKTTACWPDPDGDGFAAQGSTPTPACGTCPAKTTDKDPKLPGTVDCHPDDPDVFPGQKKWFVKSYCQPCATAGCPCVASWDFDCNGLVEKQYTTQSGLCSRNGLQCVGSGWTTGGIPECGVAANFQLCEGLTCQNASKITQPQGCH